MNELTYVRTGLAPAAIGPYSQAVVVDGWVFCSGQIPIVPDTGELVGGGIAEQTERVLANLAAVLEEAGSSSGLVVKTTVFLTSMSDFAAMNEVYARNFDDHRPARATVAVAELPMGSLVEIDCVARMRVPE
ncbi:MAG TPA: RidA family protein [Longimicrobiales bacterium]|nr:RidA family protein [Longimicrobiales bacterium]